MSKIKIKITEPAELELDEAFDFYEYEIKGLGKKFIEEFQKGIERIRVHPNAWSLIQDNIRKCLLKKFPYNIIYAIEDDLILILAIAHQHRRPDYWKDRITNL